MLINIITYIRAGFTYYIPKELVFSYMITLLKFLLISFILVAHLGIAYSILVFATTFLIADYVFFVSLLELVEDDDYEDDDEDFNF